MYWFGIVFGVAVFIFDRKTGQVKISRTLLVLFPIKESLAVLGHAVYLTSIWFYYENLAFKMIFIIQNITFFSFGILLIVSQIMQSQKYIKLINNSIELVDILKVKLRSENFFEVKTLWLFLLKTLTNIYIILGNILIIVGANYHWTDRVGVINMTILLVVNVIFFNFGFIGLLVSSAFQSNLHKYLQNCKKLKDFQEFSRIYGKFQMVFKEFTQLTQFHFFFAMVFYMVNIAACFTYLIIEDVEMKQRPSFWVMQICSIIDLTIFNMAADFVETTSRKIHFFKVDFLCNDSMEVSIIKCILFSLRNNTFFFSDGFDYITNKI